MTKEQRTNPILGTLEFELDSECWVAHVQNNNVDIPVFIGDGNDLDQNITFAEKIAENISSFMGSLQNYLLEQVEINSPPVAEEIQKLKIRDILVSTSSAKQCAMVFFTGSDKYKIWHCD